MKMLNLPQQLTLVTAALTLIALMVLFALVRGDVSLVGGLGWRRW
jgi:hypothetical protein